MKFLTSNTAILVGSRNSGYRLFFRVHLYGIFAATFAELRVSKRSGFKEI